MKNKFLALTLLITIVTMLTSCFSSRSKYGCPATAYQQKASHKI